MYTGEKTETSILLISVLRNEIHHGLAVKPLSTLVYSYKSSATSYFKGIIVEKIGISNN